MNYITKDEGEKILEPYYEFFIEIYKRALDDWNKIASLFPMQSARTRASFINDQVREYTRAKFPTGQIYERGGRFLLFLDNKIVGRYKKLKSSRPSNIPTQTSLKLENQQLELGEALEPCTLVNIGYIPNKSHTSFRYEINCIKNKDILWQISIFDDNKIDKTVDISQTDIQEQVPKKRVFKKAQ